MQANNKKLAYKPPAFIQARDVSGEVLRPTSGWPVVILNYAADSTPTAHFHKGDLNVGYLQNDLGAKVSMLHACPAVGREPSKDMVWLRLSRRCLQI